MFTIRTSHDGRPTRAAKRVGATLGVVALGAGFALAAPGAANADTTTSSYASGVFLSGTLLGGDLGNVVVLGGVEARNDGTQPLQTSNDPLKASVIQTVNVDAPQGVQLDLGEFLDAGAVNQYAEADKGGVSMGAAGAIGNDGAIGVGNVGSGAAGDLTLDLDALIGAEFASILTDLTLDLNAVSAQAVGNLTTATGDYRIADAHLTFTSPAIGQLTNKVNSALDALDLELLSMSGDDGILGNSVDGIIDPVLGVLGSSANVNVSIDAKIRQTLQALLDGQYGNGAVSFDLETGAVSIDLAALLGGDLNNLEPGTELLSGPVINQVLRGITDTVSKLADDIVDRVRATLSNAKVTVTANLDLLSGQAPLQDTVCHLETLPVWGIVSGTGVGTVLGTGGDGSGLGGLLGNLGLGGLSGVTAPVTGIIDYTTSTVCNVVTTALPDLRSTVNVNVVGTVGQLIDGTAAQADAAVSLLGGTVAADINVDAVIGSLGDGLADGLFSSDGAVTDLVNNLNTSLVNPAVDGLLGDNSVKGVLSDVLSVKANVQETNDGVFTQTAVRVSALGGDLATVNVAAASVGPNITTVVPPCTVNCGPGGNPDPCVVNCGPGNPGTTGITASNRLAMTGVGIATLIAIILALLAAGAYLAREGYRRNHPRVETPLDA